MLLTNNFKITNINNWFNERLVLCKFEQMLMEVELEPEFAWGASIKPCYKHRLCVWSFILFCSAGKNFACHVLRATPTLPDTTRHMGPGEHLCCLVISTLRGTAWVHVKQHFPRQIPNGHPRRGHPALGGKSIFREQPFAHILFTRTDIATKTNIKLEQLASSTDMDTESLAKLNGSQ